MLGPSAVQSSLGATQLFAPNSMHELPRILYIDNFRLFPNTEEQIDFVDQHDFLFGQNLVATINHITSLLYWWNEESKLLDVESTYDCTVYVCNKLVPTLMKYRNTEMQKIKKQEEEKKAAKTKPKTEESKTSIEYADVNSEELYPSADTFNNDSFDNVASNGKQ